MNTYVNQSTAVHPQRRMAAGGYINVDTIKELSEYLATVNLHGRSYWTYTLRGLPRPTGAATRAIYTEYALPRQTIEPHDVYVQNGKVWYSDFGEMYLGSLDPVTGKVTEYKIPEMKPGFPTGELDLEPDPGGTLWLSGMYQGGLESFDPKTSTFKTWPLPADMNSAGAQQSMVMPGHMDVDGLVWTNNQDAQKILRLNVKTGAYDAQGPLKDPTADRMIGSYGLLSDSHNNAILLDYGGQGIAKLDAKTGVVTMYNTSMLRSAPRRGRVFGNDQVVFAEYGADRIGTLDTHTGAMKEYPMPPGSNPYDAFADKNGELWEGSMWTDRIVRLNPKTNVLTSYLLPHQTNIRRVIVDNSTSPVTFWVGNNHDSTIVKMELQN
jgi:streptogramin lyase